MLSIITSTYNRSHLLTQCYESLCAQSNYGFEWIVIDDGSTDNTKELVSEISKNSTLFPVFYRFKKNGGKHTALNACHDLIHGDYVLILDSDDRLPEDAVQTVLDNWERYKNDSRVSMLVFLKQNIDGRVCSYAENENILTDYFRTKRIRIVTTDCCEVIRSSVYKKYPFPVYENEKYIPETVLWYRAALEGYCVYINKPVYICEYLEDGLTKSGRALRINNPKGGMYNSYLRMNVRCTFKERIKGSILYTAYGLFDKDSMIKLISGSKPYYLLFSIGYIPGFITYLHWSKKYEHKT